MLPDRPAHRPGSPGHDCAADEAWLDAWLATAWRRWRLWLGVRGMVLGLGVALVTRAVLEPLVQSAVAAASTVGLLATVLALLTARGLRDAGPLIEATEVTNPRLQNALLAWQEARGHVAPAVGARLAADARRVLASSAPPAPVSRRAWATALAILAAGVMAGLVSPADRPAFQPASHTLHDERARAAGPLGWTALVTPPAYSGRQSERGDRPVRLDLIAGSRVEVTFTGLPAGATVRHGEQTIELLGPISTPVARLVASVSDVLQVLAADSRVLASIALVVTPDAAPAVRITAPAADLRRAAATGLVTIRIAARDDLGLRDLRLRFTQVSGSGESFTFEDGEWPLEVRRPSVTEWTGSYALDLARLGLGPGDSVVYHAVAHDARTGPEGAAESERFLIEIARPGAVAAGDFSLPEPEEKFALSQRMVIQLTERLLERRPRISAEQFRDEAQALAIAQRRVRAEFVFMLGGEVEDEFEEAAHSHEVEAGRLDNRGQGDLTEAVRQMSQAETRLTAADVREALPYEYRALSALQAAFGKARYFMRTLPATVQIDQGRRLQGDRTEASSSRWENAPLAEADRAAALAVLGRLEVPGTSVASVLPALVALDRSDAAWVAQAQAAADDDDGLAGITHALRARLLASSPAWMPMPLGRSSAEAAMATSAGARKP